ncbi:helix-turn-helix domain-containing protein [Parvibium lacunae]|uniref:XRE family transcriptional regulator n=1 Tax=Parvibium lacunae TaxID=1888893 RepID=A0A368KYR8_9BURK|nr:helix-turn-helix transcriptional regulator [Parvibium lacunae]RCS56553.1 XRE family transcriptional regulator [Parvibium lacunae]
MSQLLPVIENLKKELRARGITYGELAKQLDMSEASVKRMFAKRDFTLKRLEEILEVAELDLPALMKISDPESQLKSSLTAEQESEIVADPKLFLVAVCVLNLWPIEEIVARYQLTSAEVVALLLRLDRMGFLQLQPNNRVRLLISRTFNWLPDGPIQRAFKDSAALDYLDSRFDRRYEHMAFINGMLSKKSALKFIEKIQQLAKEFSVWHQEESTLPLQEKVPMSMLLAIRPWLPRPFQPLLRQESPGAAQKPSKRVHKIR